MTYCTGGFTEWAPCAIMRVFLEHVCLIQLCCSNLSLLLDQSLANEYKWASLSYMTIQVSCAKCLLADAFIMRSCRVLHFIYNQHVLPWRNSEEFLTNETLQPMSFPLKNALSLFFFFHAGLELGSHVQVMILAFKKNQIGVAQRN